MVLDFRLGTRVALIKYLGQNKKVTSHILHFVGNFSTTLQDGELPFINIESHKSNYHCLTLKN